MFNKRTTRRQTQDSYRPKLESLESRIVLADDYWRGAISNLWSNAGNWSLGATPTSDDTVIFDNQSPNCRADAVNPMYATTLKSIQMTGYTNTLTPDVNLNFSSFNTITSGNITGNGTLTMLGGSFTWTGGTVMANMVLNSLVTTDAGSQLPGGSIVVGQLTNKGTVNFSSNGDGFDVRGFILNLGIWNINSDGRMVFDSGQNPVGILKNGGTLTKASAGVVNIEIPFVNGDPQGQTAQFFINSGTVNFTGTAKNTQLATTTIAAAATLYTTTTYEIAGGFLTGGDGATVDGNLKLSAGVVQPDGADEGDLVVTKNYNQTGGILDIDVLVSQNGAIIRNDRLRVMTGTVTLGGTSQLAVQYNGGSPAGGQSCIIIRYLNLVGDFATKTSSGVPYQTITGGGNYQIKIRQMMGPVNATQSAVASNSTSDATTAWFESSNGGLVGYNRAWLLGLSQAAFAALGLDDYVC